MIVTLKIKTTDDGYVMYDKMKSAKFEVETLEELNMILSKFEIYQVYFDFQTNIWIVFVHNNIDDWPA